MGWNITGFARNNATLKYDGPDNNIVIQGLISGTTYYARFLAYDDFGESEQLNLLNILLHYHKLSLEMKLLVLQLPRLLLVL